MRVYIYTHICLYMYILLQFSLHCFFFLFLSWHLFFPEANMKNREKRLDLRMPAKMEVNAQENGVTGNALREQKYLGKQMTESEAVTTRSLLEINMNEMLCFVDWVYFISLNITIVFMLQLPNLVPTCHLIYKAITSWTVINKAEGRCSDYTLIIALKLIFAEKIYILSLPCCSQRFTSEL